MIASTEQIENSGSSAWSPDELTTIAGWKVTSSGGFTRRINSASSNGWADTSLTTRDAVATWLARRGADLTVRVTPLMDKKVANDCELKWGLEPRDETIVMLRRPSSEGSYGEVLVVQPDDAAYTSDLFDLNRHDSSLRASWDRVVERTRSSAVGLWIPGKAVGFAVVQDGIASVFSVAVRMNDRRRGLATGIMNASATWAVEEGAEWQFAQVLGTNRVAIELYERLGFGERYRYRYLQAPGGR